MPWQSNLDTRTGLRKRSSSPFLRHLKARGLGFAITDVALRRDVLHMCLTNQTAFIRFNGYGLHQSDYKRLDEWIARLKLWREAGIEKVYFFMHQANEEHTPVLVNYFSKKTKCGNGTTTSNV